MAERYIKTFAIISSFQARRLVQYETQGIPSHHRVCMRLCQDGRVAVVLHIILLMQADTSVLA